MATTYGSDRRRLARTAEEIKRYRLLMKILPIAATCLALVISITYIAAILYNRFGSFTVSINRFDNVDYSLALCETPEFEKPITRLKATPHSSDGAIAPSGFSSDNTKRRRQ